MLQFSDYCKQNFAIALWLLLKKGMGKPSLYRLQVTHFRKTFLIVCRPFGTQNLDLSSANVVLTPPWCILAWHSIIIISVNLWSRGSIIGFCASISESELLLIYPRIWWYLVLQSHRTLLLIAQNFLAASNSFGPLLPNHFARFVALL